MALKTFKEAVPNEKIVAVFADKTGITIATECSIYQLVEDELFELEFEVEDGA